MAEENEEKEEEIEDLSRYDIESEDFNEATKLENVLNYPTLNSPLILGGTKINAGSGDKCFKFEPDKGLWLGNANFDNAPFRVDMDGNVTGTKATFSQYFHKTNDTTDDITEGINNLFDDQSASAKANAGLDASGNLIKEVINNKLNTSSKKILDEFTFDDSGAIAIKTDADNGIWISPTGILAKKSGNTTFTIDNSGDATFAGTLSAAAGTLGTITAGTFEGVTITGNTIQTATSGQRVVLDSSGNAIQVYDSNNNKIFDCGTFGYGYLSLYSRNATRALYVHNSVNQTSVPLTEIYSSGAGTNQPTLKVRGVGGGNKLEISDENDSQNTTALYVYKGTNADGKGIYIVLDNSITSANPLRIRNDGSGSDVYDENGAYLSNAGVWTDASSRKLKTDFKEINLEDIVNKIKKLKIVNYRYKKNLKSKKEIRHITPMAEDVNKLFGVGEKEGLSGTQLASLALLGVKYLLQKVKT